ncbi:hypothetical protein [Stutzerimonas azotifigens]|uniref:hypothetical protein n=1 Tax=Stutzerimonas azotifigens TaxID=291995 RepID=UPI00041BE09D|nr:hypothetical protein [Stutzerimonas azotifigens]
MELNKAVLDCMQQLRRRLRDEQQLDIRLSQPDAVSAMLAACLDSSDEHTRSLGRQLAGYSDLHNDFAQPARASEPEFPPGAPVLIYRGRRVVA